MGYLAVIALYTFSCTNHPTLTHFWENIPEFKNNINNNCTISYILSLLLLMQKCYHIVYVQSLISFRFSRFLLSQIYLSNYFVVNCVHFHKKMKKPNKKYLKKKKKYTKNGIEKYIFLNNNNSTRLLKKTKPKTNQT